jgi:hypothetical protein
VGSQLLRDGETVAQLLQAVVRCREQKLAREMEQQMAREVERRLAAVESSQQKHVQWIREQLLTLHCPRCQQSFVDFDKCFALTCSRCRAGFCGWCLQDCGKDAHQHVAGCAHNQSANRSVYGTKEAFEATHRERRKQAVEGYLQEKLGSADPGMRQAVQREIEPNLRELGIQIYAGGGKRKGRLSIIGLRCWPRSEGGRRIRHNGFSMAENEHGWPAPKGGGRPAEPLACCAGTALGLCPRCTSGDGVWNKVEVKIGGWTPVASTSLVP